MSAAISIEPAASRIRSAVVPLALSAASAVLALLVPYLGPVATADGSSAAAAVNGAWWALLPVVVAAVTLALRPELTLPIVAGAAAISFGRLVADAGLLLDPDAVLRPEWFGIGSVTAFPLQATAAAAVPVVADLIALVAFSLAARTVLDGYEPPDQIDGRRRTVPATPFLLVGLIAAGCLTTAGLAVPYAAPVPVVRPLGVADIGLFGSFGAAVSGVVVFLAVVLAASLPVAAGRGIVIGIGAAVGVAPLIAILSGAEGGPSTAAWFSLVAALVLAGSAALRHGPSASTVDASGPADRRDPADPVDPVDPAADHPAADASRVTIPIWSRVMVPVLGLAATAAATMAFVTPQATVQRIEAGSAFEAAAAGFLPAAVLLGLATLLTVLPRTAAVGCQWLGLAWAPAAAAMVIALEFVSSSIWVNTAVFVNVTGVSRAAGTWWGLAAVVLAIAAAVAGAGLAGRIRDTATDVIDMDAIERGSAPRVLIGSVLTAVLVATTALPVFRVNGRDSAALFVADARIDGYGQWLILLTTVVGVWLAARQPRRSVALLLLVGVALTVATRLVLSTAVRAQTGFEMRPGFWVTMAAIALVLAAGAVVWLLFGPAPLLTPLRNPAPSRARVPAGAASGRSGAVGRAPVGSANKRVGGTAKRPASGQRPRGKKR